MYKHTKVALMVMMVIFPPLGQRHHHHHHLVDDGYGDGDHHHHHHLCGLDGAYGHGYYHHHHLCGLHTELDHAANLRDRDYLCRSEKDKKRKKLFFAQFWATFGACFCAGGVARWNLVNQAFWKCQQVISNENLNIWNWIFALQVSFGDDDDDDKGGNDDEGGDDNNERILCVRR